MTFGLVSKKVKCTCNYVRSIAKHIMYLLPHNGINSTPLGLPNDFGAPISLFLGVQMSILAFYTTIIVFLCPFRCHQSIYAYTYYICKILNFNRQAGYDLLILLIPTI